MATIIEDLDTENLLEHLCLEEEAKELRSWVADKTPRPAGVDKRLSSAAKLRGKGNVAYERKEWDAAVWLYLAALHHVDYSLKDSRADKLADSAVGIARLREEIARMCANLAAAFSAKEDAYNAARSATLGLEYAEKCRSAKDEKKPLRAKLLYRRGVARARNAGQPNARPDDTVEDGLADLKEACRLDDSKDRGMREAYRKLKLRADAAPPAYAAGFLKADLPPGVEAVADVSEAPAAASPPPAPVPPPPARPAVAAPAPAPASPSPARSAAAAPAPAPPPPLPARPAPEPEPARPGRFRRVLNALSRGVDHMPPKRRERVVVVLVSTPIVAAFAAVSWTWRDTRSPHQVVNVVAIFALIVARLVVTYRKFRRAAAKRFVVREMLASKKRA